MILNARLTDVAGEEGLIAECRKQRGMQGSGFDVGAVGTD